MAYSPEAVLLEEWTIDLNNVAEDKLSAFVNCTVQDSTFSPNTTNRAKKSLPKKLTLKPTNATHNSTEVGVWAQKHIPKGTRFGPIVGEIKPVKGDSDSSNFFMVGDVKIVTEDVNKTFIWNVFSKAASQVPTVIDVGDILKSNWMRYVQFAENKDAQNLVAYQDGSDIFFLAMRDIQKDEELAVWFCKEFAGRVHKPESPLEWRETCAATTNVEISIKISDKQSEEGSSVRDNESDSGYAGSPICDQNESDENSYSENKHDNSKSFNENSSGEHLLDSGKKSHAEPSCKICAEVLHLQRDLNVEITPGSKFIKLRGKSFFQSIFYCLLCKSGTGLFMGDGDLIHHFQVTCKTCVITFHGFQDFQEHMISTHEKMSSNQLHQLFKEWSQDFIDEIYGHEVDTKASEVDNKASDAVTKVSDVDTKVVDVYAKAFDADTKACDGDNKASDVDTKGSDVNTEASDVDTKASYVYTKESGMSSKESVLNMIIDIERMERCERGELSCKLNIEKEATDGKIELVENILDDSKAKKSSLLKLINMDQEEEKQRSLVKRRSDIIMKNIKMGPYKQEIDGLQQSRMEKDNMIKGKVEELKKCCQLSSNDDADNKASDVDIKGSDVDTEPSDVDTEASYVYTKESGVISCTLNIEKEAADKIIELVENVNLNDSQANKSSLLKHRNIDEELVRNLDENIKMERYMQKIDGLQKSHMEKDNMIKGKMEELKMCCLLSTIDCQNVNTVYEQAIEVLQRSEQDKNTLFTKLDSIQKGATGDVMATNVENGNSGQQVNEMKKERKREKAPKPYCARASCPNKGRHRCSRCKAVFYCHEDCLTEDWPHHKTFCDYVYEANKCPDDSSKKDPPETEDSGGRDEVD